MPSSCRTLAAALGALLLAAELAIAALGLWFPREPLMYRQFYIAHTRQCWLPPDAEAAAIRALRQPDLDPAAFTRQTACYAFADGFSPAPPWNQTTQATASWLDLPPPPGAKALAMTLADTSPASRQIIWVRLGRQRARVTLPPRQVPVNVTLPLPARTGEFVQIRFLRPHEPDGNPMAVLRLKWIEP